MAEMVTKKGVWPMIILCARCFTMIELQEFTNTCPGCQQDYNPMGQVLAPREQWGEETGESLSEILAIGHYEPEVKEQFDIAMTAMDNLYNILGASMFLSIVTDRFVSEHIMPKYRTIWYDYIHKALDRINEINIKEEQEAAEQYRIENNPHRKGT